MSNGQPFTCADCHGDNIAEFDRAKCETCHREYQADFVTKHVADFGSDCLACHDGADRFSRFDHNRLPFTLTGEHSQIACGQCHAQVRAVADFKSASPDCVDCHQKDDAAQRRIRDGLRAVPNLGGLEGREVRSHSGGVQTRGQAPDGRVQTVPRQQRLQGHTADLRGLPSEG